MPVPVTLLYGSLCGLLLTLLAMNISLQRGRYKAGVGQVPPELVRHVRAHGNATEYIPIALILLMALELSGVSNLWLHMLGGVFVLGRLFHAFGLIARMKVAAMGTTLTHASILAMSCLGLVWHLKR